MLAAIELSTKLIAAVVIATVLALESLATMSGPIVTSAVSADLVRSVRPIVRLVVALAVMRGGTTCGDEPERSIPERHDARMIEGWTVQIDARLLSDENSALGEAALKLMSADLLAISGVIPADRLEKLREVPIWIDLSHGDLRQMQYHPSADWLREHGYSEQLARGVHIPRAALFTDVEHRRTQPWATLHELAHAYHDRVLGFDEPRIAAAHERFRQAERYRSVLHVDGGRREHYGRTNPMEFFAELTESYFGTNDFYPFVRGELREDNPDVCVLLEEIWGVPRGR